MAVFLTVNHEFGQEFADMDELKVFINKELSAFEWLKAVPDARLKEATIAAHKLFIGDPLDASLKMGKSSGEYHWGDATDPMIRGDSPDAQLLSRLALEGQYTVAFFVFVLLTPKRRQKALSTRVIYEVLTSPLFEFDRQTANGIINAWTGTNNYINQAAVDSARTASNNFKEYAANASGELSASLKNFKKDTDAAKKNIQNETNFIRHRFKRRSALLTAYVKKSMAASRNALKDSKDHLNSAKEAYSAQIDLKASVAYWTARKKRHTTAKYVAFVCVVLSMLLTLVCMYFYLTNFEIPGVEAVAAGTGINAETLTAKNITALLSHFLGAALLLTFLGILVKIALRQFNTHSNCALEAEERITFTKTYLALMHEGKLSSDFDRKLVLESLFRPNSFSNAQEFGLALPLEFIAKAFEKR